MYAFIEDPYLIVGKNLYQMYLKTKNEKIEIENGSFVSESLIHKIMNHPKQIGCQSFDDFLKMLIASYHINCSSRYPKTSSEPFRQILKYQFQKWEFDISHINFLEDICDQEFLEQLRKSNMLFLIETSSSLDEFKEKLFSPLLKEYIGKFNSPLDDLINLYYSVLEELIEEFIKNYQFYQLNNIIPLVSELGWSNYDMYRKENGYVLFEKYQIPYQLMELRENLRCEILENSTDELTFSWLLLDYRTFKRKYPKIKPSNYLHYLMKYLKIKNIEGYNALKHVLLKCAYISLAVRKDKTKNEYYLMKKLSINQLSEKELENNAYFLKDFYQVVDSPSLQQVFLRENEKGYVKKFDRRLK